MTTRDRAHSVGRLGGKAEPSGWSLPCGAKEVRGTEPARPRWGAKANLYFESMANYLKWVDAGGHDSGLPVPGDYTSREVPAAPARERIERRSPVAERLSAN